MHSLSPVVIHISVASYVIQVVLPPPPSFPFKTLNLPQLGAIISDTLKNSTKLVDQIMIFYVLKTTLGFASMLRKALLICVF